MADMMKPGRALVQPPADDPYGNPPAPTPARSEVAAGRGMRRIKHLYAGADWIAQNNKVTLSPVGLVVADILGFVYRGIYHLPAAAIRKTDWSEPFMIRISVDDSGLATFDGSSLTELVILAHECCVRFSVQQSGPRKLALCFWPREREGVFSRRHPTIEQAIATIRNAFSLVDAQPLAADEGR